MSYQVRLDDDVYERIKANKRDDESFSDAVERLISGRPLQDLHDIFDEDQVSEMRDAIEAADRKDRHEVREVAERFDKIDEHQYREQRRVVLRHDLA